MKRPLISLPLVTVDIVILWLARLAKLIVVFPRAVKRAFVFVSDLILCVISVLLAFYLRVGGFVSLSGPVLIVVMVSVSFALPIFVVLGLYRSIFRYSGLHGMVSLCRAVLLYGLAFSAIFTVWSIDGVPRTVGLIQPILLFLFVGASRATARVWLGGMYQQQLRKASCRRRSFTVLAMRDAN